MLCLQADSCLNLPLECNSRTQKAWMPSLAAALPRWRWNKVASQALVDLACPMQLLRMNACAVHSASRLLSEARTREARCRRTGSNSAEQGGDEPRGQAWACSSSLSCWRVSGHSTGTVVFWHMA